MTFREFITLQTRDRVICCAGIAIASLIVYWQVGGFEFVNFDDDAHVYQNSNVTTGLTRDNLIWAFSIHGPSQWHPLAWISHQIDCELFDLESGAHHVSNAAFHVITAILLFITLVRMTDDTWKSAFVAALFAVHPLNVESVAWVAERRNVLCGLFWMATLLAYCSYVRRMTLGSYAMLLAMFAAALMSKPMAVVLPFVLLLLDYFPLRRLRSPEMLHLGVSPGVAVHTMQLERKSLRFLCLEKVPLLLMSAGSSILTILCQRSVKTIATLDAIPFSIRVTNAVASYGIYLRKLAWPVDLSVFYPHPAYTSCEPMAELAMTAAVSAIVLCAISIVAIIQRQRYPFLIVGWLWFLGVLFPMNGLVQVGRQQLADRYTYIASIGLFLALAWSLPALLAGNRYLRIGTRIAACGIIVVAAWVGRIQTSHWRTSITLWEHALSETDRNSWAHNNLGLAYQQRWRYRLAFQHFQEALTIDPDYAVARFNLGILYQQTRNLERAEAEFRRAIESQEHFEAAHSRLGTLLAELGQLDESIRHLQKVIDISPDSAEAHLNLAIAYGRSEDYDSANRHFQQSIALDPANPAAHFGLALGRLSTGDVSLARSHLLQAIELRPGFAAAHVELGKLELKEGNRAAAATSFRRALSLDSTLQDALHGLKQTQD